MASRIESLEKQQNALSARLETLRNQLALAEKKAKALEKEKQNILERQNAKTRKARTRALIELGAVAVSVIRVKPTHDVNVKFLQWLKGYQDELMALFAEDSPEDITTDKTELKAMTDFRF